MSRIESISDGTFNPNKTKWTNDVVTESDFLQQGDILFSHINSIKHIGKTAIFRIDTKIIHGANLVRLRTSNPKILPDFAIFILKSKQFLETVKKYANQAVNQASINTASIKSLQIPLPPINIQQEIVAELEKYQKIIDGGRQVVENYTPTFDIDPDWETTKIKKHC